MNVLYGLVAFLLVTAVLVAAVSAQAAEAETRGLALLGYEVHDDCGGSLQRGENGAIRLYILYLSSQAVAEYVVLDMHLENMDSANITPSHIVWGPVVMPGEAHLVSAKITVPASVAPGSYRLVINYTVVYLDGEILNGTLDATIAINDCPLHGLAASARLEPFSYPGTVGAHLSLRLVNQGNESLRNVSVRIILPEGWRPSSRTYHLDALEGKSGKVFTLDNVYVPAWIESGNYSLTVEVNYTCRVCGGNTTVSRIVKAPLEVKAPPPLHASTKAYWLDGYAYTGEQGARLVFQLQLLEPLRLTGLNYSLLLPPGFQAAPETQLQGFLELNTGYGDTASLNFGLNTPDRPGCYQFLLAAAARVEDNDTTTWRPVESAFTLCIKEPHIGLEVAQAYWSSWIAGPRGYDLTARLKLLYEGNDTLERLVANVTAEPPALIRGKTVSPVDYEGAPAGHLSLITISIPGIVTPENSSIVKLGLRGQAVLSTPGGGRYRAPVSLNIDLPVVEEEPLRLLWANHSPAHIVAGAGRVEVTLRLENNGSTPLQVLWVEPRGLPGGIRYMGAEGACLSGPVAGGSACSLTLTLNVSNVAAREYEYWVRVRYSYRLAEGVVTAEKWFPLRLRVDDPRVFAPQLELVSAYWSDSTGAPVQVLPGDRDAMLRVVMYNPGPFNVEAVRAHLDGWNSTTATCQTIPVNGFCTLILYTTPRAEVTPSLDVVYSSEVYGANVGVSESFRLNLTLANPLDAFRVEGVEWLNPPEPGSRTARLGVALSINPRLVESIVSVKLVLPRGFSSPQTGENIVYLHTFSQEDSLMQALAWIGQAPQGAAPLFQNMATPGQAAARFEATIAVGGSPESGKAELVIEWRSHYGSLHVARYTLHLPKPVSASTLLVWSEPRSPMRGGVANVTIYIANRGTGAAYNVYLYLAPLSRTGFPVSPVARIGVLPPGSVKQVTAPVVFNPSSFGGEKSYTFAAVAAVVYDDELGFRRFINVTVSSVLEPVVRLIVKQASASIGAEGVVVKGVVANVGLDPAESVAVSVSLEGLNTTASEFLGSVDAGTESPFKITIGGVAGNRTNVILRVSYMDSYGYEYVIVKKLRAEKEAPATKPVATGTEVERSGKLGLSSTHVAIASLVVGAAALILYLRRGGGSRIEEEGFEEV